MVRRTPPRWAREDESPVARTPPTSGGGDGNAERLPVRIHDTVRSVERALRVLGAFSSSRPALSQGQLAAAANLPKSTALRLIRTLIESGWLFVRTDELITVGPCLIPIAQVVERQWSISESSKLVLEGVVSRTSETANVYVRDGLNRICIAQHQSPLSVRYVIPVGVSIPVWLGASGHILLADSAPSVLSAAMDAGALNPRERSNLVETLERTKADGYSVTHGEREAGASSVAVPITDSSGRTIAALAISGPTFRFDEERLPGLVGVARAASDQLSHSGGPLISV